ncbi:MAG: TolC family outer membrane protein [Steroidobacteraceae bacterium]
MKRLVAACSALVLVNVASGKDLMGVYQDALRFDTQIREAEATYKAAREASPEAWAALLPQLTGSYALTRQKQGEEEVFPYPGPNGVVVPFSEDSTSFINTHGYQLQLQETIFSWANLATLAEARKQVAEAEATYRAAEENLVQRVATAYFNVLNAKDTLDANAASLDALSRQLEQANKRFQVGLIAVTDVQEAQAARDSAAAAVIAAKRTLASMEQQLREITEQDYPSLAKPGDSMPLKDPEPADPKAWISVSMDQNLSLVASRLAADVAREQVGVAFGGHLPTLAITGTRSDETENTDEAYNFGGAPGRLRYPFELGDSEIGIQINVPIFSGGLVQSQVHQAEYQWIAAKDHVQTVSRETEFQARDAYNGVVSEVAQVEALRQGVQSAEVALTATEAGYQVGTRTEVDVLQERQNLVQAETNYAQARYTYLLDMVQLQLAAGTLDQRTIEQINGWLTVEQRMSTSPVTEPAPPTVVPQP